MNRVVPASDWDSSPYDQKRCAINKLARLPERVRIPVLLPRERLPVFGRAHALALTLVEMVRQAGLPPELVCG